MKKTEYPSGKRVRKYPPFTESDDVAESVAGGGVAESAFSRLQDRLILCGCPRYRANEGNFTLRVGRFDVCDFGVWGKFLK